MSFYSKTIGWARLDRGEMIGSVLNTLDQNMAAKELGVWNWQWDFKARQLDLADKEKIKGLIKTQLMAEIASEEGPIYSGLNALLKKIVPEDLSDKFKAALNYADKDDKINGIISTKVDFGMSGFRVSSSDKKKEKIIYGWNRDRRIYNVLLKSWNVAAVCDNVVLLLKKKAKSISVLPLPNLKIVPIHTVDDKGHPEFRAFLKLPREIIDFIRIQQRASGKKAKTKGLKDIPDKWIFAAQHPQRPKAEDPIHPVGGYVELTEEDDEYVFILNSKGEEDRLVIPSMTSVFPSIELRSYLQDGEFSIAYLIKYFIHQIKVGPKAEGLTLQQVLRQGKVTKEDREEVKENYRVKVDKAIFEVTNQTLEHVFHFPGADVDMGKRYATPDERIEWWARISRQIIRGDVGSYSGGLVYLKGYSRNIDRFRGLFAQFLEDIYVEMLKDGNARVKWDQHYMKEPRQKLSEMQLMVSHGMDMETVCSILDYDWQQFVSDREKTLSPEILKLKEDEKESWKYWQEIQRPFFEPNQGMLIDNPGGRPPLTDEQTDDQQTESQPRPEVTAAVGTVDHG